MKQTNIEIGNLVKIVGLRKDKNNLLKDILKRYVDKTNEISYIPPPPGEVLPSKFGVITRILMPYKHRKDYLVYEFLCGGHLYFTSTRSYLKKINNETN